MSYEEPRPSVLIAEDNPAMALVVQFNLERAGFEAVVADHGEEAWELLQNRNFDLVVTDQQMPKLSGRELLERMRQQDSTRSTPVILLTAKGLEMDVRRLQEELAIAAVFLKPFSPRALVQEIRQCLAVGPVSVPA